MKSTSAYRKVIDKGKNITLNKVLYIYKNEASVNAHFQLTCSDSKIHKIQDNYHSSDERWRRRQSTDYRTANTSTTAKGEGLLKRNKVQCTIQQLQNEL